MNCATIQQELDLYFGSDSLPDDLRLHIATCPDCKSYWLESLELAGEMNRQGEFKLNESELDNLVASVDRRVATTDILPLVTGHWMRVLTRVAAAVLVVATSYGAYLIGSNGVLNPDQATMIDTTVVAVYEDETEVDPNMVTVMIDEYSESAYFGIDEAILGDLSEAELEYLKENFSVEDLL